MKKGGLFTLVISVLLLLGFSQPVLAADGTLVGAVTTASDALPIDTQLFYIQMADTGAYYGSFYTDAAGNYTVTLPEDEYTIYNYYYDYNDSDIAYIQQVKNVLITGGNISTLDFALTRRGRISGHVYTSDGVTPVYGADLSAYNTIDGDYGYDWAETSSTGYYNMSPMPDDYTTSAAGTYTVYITQAGYLSVMRESVEVFDENTTELNVNLIRHSTVSGNVIDKDGNPLEGAIVYVGHKSINAYGSETTDAAGNYTITISNSIYNSSDTGAYNVTVSKNEYITYASSLSIDQEESDLTDINFVLNRGGMVMGKVTDASSNALTGVTISADDGFGNSYSTATADDGTYTLSSLRQSSNYTITATLTGFVAKKKYHVEVVEGEATEDQDYKLEQATTYTGTIKDKQGNALSSALISLYNRNRPRGSGYDYYVYTDSNGIFSFNNIIPGNYRIKITKAGYLTYKKEKINLKQNLEDQTYQLTKASSIYGRITNKGEGVGNATVVVNSSKKDSDTGYSYTYTDNQGYYRISGLEKGKYKIKVTTTDYALKYVTKKIKAGIEAKVDIKVAKAGSISGYIKDANSNLPIPWYTVKVRGMENTGSSDANGYYIIDGLSPGRYKLYIVSNWYQDQYYNQSTTAKSAEWVTVKANKTTGNVNFSLILK